MAINMSTPNIRTTRNPGKLMCAKARLNSPATASNVRLTSWAAINQPKSPVFKTALRAGAVRPVWYEFGMVE